MKIQRKILTEEVIIPGIGFTGKKSTIKFTPYGKPGWWWDTQSNGIVPIDHRIAFAKKGRLQLRRGNEKMDVPEHLLALKWVGLDGFMISLEHNSWIPYFTAWEFWVKIKPFTEKTQEYIPSVFLKEDTKDFISNSLCSEARMTKADHFSMTLASQWEDLPLYKDTISNVLYNQSFMEQILSAKPQGLSHRKWFASLVSSLGIWPHIKNVSWKKDFKTKEEASYAWWLHFGQDRLGELALSSHEALPIGDFFFWKTGHKQVLSCVKKSFPIPIN